jgi:peptide chain release factor 2
VEKKLLFSVTSSDCEWDYFNASGAGGQNVNKNQCGVRCHHPASGARGQAQDTRSQAQNKVLAFKRMRTSPEFQRWHRLEVARRMGLDIDIDAKVEAAMKDKNLKIEVKQDGKWVPET